MLRGLLKRTMNIALVLERNMGMRGWSESSAQQEARIAEMTIFSGIFILKNYPVLKIIKLK